MRRLMFITGVAVFLTSFVFGGARPVAGKVIEWKVIRGMDSTDPVMINFTFPVIDAINKKGAGRLKIMDAGGPESYPAFEQMKAVREGVFQMMSTHVAYYIGELRTAVCTDLIPNPSQELRAAGFLDLVDEMHQKKLNVKVLGHLSTGVGYQLLSNKKLEKADLRGLRIRTGPIYVPMAKELGAVTVTMPFPEIYGALEKRVVDAAFWTGVGPLQFKWYEVTKYLVRPIFGTPTQTLYVNLDAWKALPPDLQSLMQEVIIDFENTQRAVLMKIARDEELELLKKGMELNVLPAAEATKWVETFYRTTWEEFIVKQDPIYGPRLKSIADKLVKK